MDGPNSLPMCTLLRLVESSPIFDEFLTHRVYFFFCVAHCIRCSIPLGDEAAIEAAEAIHQISRVSFDVRDVAANHLILDVYRALETQFTSESASQILNSHVLLLIHLDYV